MKGKNKREKVMNNQKHLSRRYFLSTIAGSLFLGILGYFYLTLDKKINFEDAKYNYELRQEYIDQVVSQYESREGIRETKYENRVYGSDEYGRLGGVMRTHLYVPANYRGTDLEMDVIIYQNAFVNLTSQDEFLSCLIDHEYRHVDQTRGRVKLRFPSKVSYDSIASEIHQRLIEVKGDLFYIYRELDAYSTQIDSFKVRNDLSKGFQDAVFSRYNDYVDSLLSKQNTPLVLYLRDKFRKREY